MKKSEQHGGSQNDPLDLLRIERYRAAEDKRRVCKDEYNTMGK